MGFNGTKGTNFLLEIVSIALILWATSGLLN